MVIRGTFHTSCPVHSTADDPETIKEMVKNTFIMQMAGLDIFPTVESIELTEEH